MYGTIFPLLSLSLFIHEVVVNHALCWLFVLLAGCRMRIHWLRWAGTDSLCCWLQWMCSATFCYSLSILSFSLLNPVWYSTFRSFLVGSNCCLACQLCNLSESDFGIFVDNVLKQKATIPVQNWTTLVGCKESSCFNWRVACMSTVSQTVPLCLHS